jgi:hypothetical protein
VLFGTNASAAPDVSPVPPEDEKAADLQLQQRQQQHHQPDIHTTSPSSVCRPPACAPPDMKPLGFRAWLALDWPLGSAAYMSFPRSPFQGPRPPGLPRPGGGSAASQLFCGTVASRLQRWEIISSPLAHCCLLRPGTSSSLCRCERGHQRAVFVFFVWFVFHPSSSPSPSAGVPYPYAPVSAEKEKQRKGDEPEQKEIIVTH